MKENSSIVNLTDGEFILIDGPMFAGKSKTLMDLFYNKGINFDAFSSSLDTRSKEIISRDYPNKTIPCKKISNPMDITKSDSNIVVVDEFQFMGPVELLIDAVKELKKQKKTLVMAGLDLLANGEEWKNYTALKKLCDKEIKLKARCSICNKPAGYTKMISGDSSKSIQIESKEVKYEPRCQEHFR